MQAVSSKMERGVEDMANEQPIIGPAGTRIYSDGRYNIVRFRDTDVVKIAYLDIRLDSGGSRSFIVQSRALRCKRLST